MTESDQKVSVELLRNGASVYKAQLGDASAVPSLWGLWSYDGHWVLEVAHSTKRPAQDSTAGYDEIGEVVRDGQSLNAQQIHLRAKSDD